MVNRDRLVRTFLDLVEINSPSKAERGVADYLKPKLVSLGFDVREDDAGERIGGNCGNVIAVKDGTSGAGIELFLCSHMDTVEPTEGMTPHVDDEGIIRSGGKTILGADDKAGIAAILEAATAAAEQGVPFRRLQILFTVDPDALVSGVGFIFDTEKPVAGLVISAPSHENLLVTITGKASHAGIHPEAGVSAILAASKAITKMKLGRIDEETTANVGVIQGGKARNIVPDRVEIKAEARSRNEGKLRAQVDHMVQTFKESAQEIGATADIHVEHEYTTYRWTKDDAPVKLGQAAAKSIGIKSELVHGGGGSDANIFNEKGVPAVVVGVGYEGAHSKDEHLDVDDLVKAAEYALALIAESGKYGGLLR
jgi:tripeptide aminopeptidase